MRNRERGIALIALGLFIAAAGAGLVLGWSGLPDNALARDRIEARQGR